jgi:hypothetical protein
MKLFPHSVLASVILLTAASSHASTSDCIDGQSADSVLGQADFDSGVAGSVEYRVSLPGGIAADQASGKAFASDLNNNRVLRYRSYEALSNGAAADLVLCQPDFATV